MSGNEEADACGMQTTAIIDGAPRPVPFIEAAALIRRGLMGPPPTNCRTKEFYTKTFSWPADCLATSTPRDTVHLARLRAGHVPSETLWIRTTHPGSVLVLVRKTLLHDPQVKRLNNNNNSTPVGKGGMRNPGWAVFNLIDMEIGPTHIRLRDRGE